MFVGHSTTKFIFYLAFTVCLLIKPRFIALGAWFFLPIIFAYPLKSTFTLSTKGYDFSSVILSFLTNPIILEFGIGVLTGHTYLYLLNKAIFKSIFFSIVCFSLIAIGIIFSYLTAYDFPSAFSFFFFIFPLKNQKILKFVPKPLIMLDNISFSWYLIHNSLAGFISGKVEKHSL